MEAFININSTNYKMIGNVPFEFDRKMSDISEDEVIHLIETCTIYSAEDISRISPQKLRHSDHVNIEINMRDRNGNRVENAKGYLILLSSERMFFSSYASGVIIDFDSKQAEQYLKSQNFK